MRTPHNAEFTREYGCTETEWLRWLPDAVHGCAWRQPSDGSAEVDLPPGRLGLRWTVQPERRIALIRLPRLEVHFAFAGVPAERRAEFLRLFDLHTQRGGG